ncbi:hypothetical protein GOP47_0026415 [Adiantum capillus-veneris]|nr:hypothetical protein GOP47_0026415 [Adiantum capillus-veneris]
MSLPLLILVSILITVLQAQCWEAYDSTAYSKCYTKPKRLLYEGGILINPDFNDGLRGWSANGNCVLQLRNSSSSSPQNLSEKLFQEEEEEEAEEGTNWFVVAANRTAAYNGPSQLLPNLTSTLKYSLSAWLQVSGPAQNVFIKATLAVDGGKRYLCGGTVIAQSGCWSFLKGGFSLDALGTSSTSARLYFETTNFTTGTELWLDRASVQPFSNVEWKSHQAAQKELRRQRVVSLRVVDSDTGRRIHDADIQVVNAKLNFPFGSAIVQNILDNHPYQKWFLERFNTAVFGNEMKWYATEKKQGQVDYNVTDAMMAFCEANNLSVRGHNVVWDDARFQQQWVKAMVGRPADLQAAVMARVNSVVGRYAGRVIDWDVNNELLHFSFYEDALSDPSFSTSLFLAVQALDPSAQLFLNEYNTIEDCHDLAASPDVFLGKLSQLAAAGVFNLAIGLESHFTTPNLPFIRSTLDKLASLGLPIWLTELDVNVQALNNNITKAAIYLEDILREAFSHPAVEGIVMWTAWEPNGCYRMCLTDNNMANLATGDVVDALLREWQQVEILSHRGGASKWRGPIGVHNVSINWQNNTYYASLLVNPGKGIQHFVVEIPTTSSILQTQEPSRSSAFA